MLDLSVALIATGCAQNKRKLIRFLYRQRFHPPIKRHRSCEPHLFGQVGFLVSRIVKVVRFDVRHHWTSVAIGCARPFDLQRHWARRDL